MMLLLVAVSFVITGIVSSLHFKNANKIYHKDRLLRKEKAIEAHLIREIAQVIHSPNKTMDLNAIIAEEIQALSKIHHTDVMLYGMNGHIIMSSNPELLVDGTMPRQLPEGIRYRRNQVVNFRSDKSNDSEIMVYAAELIDDDGHPLGIMVVPYALEDYLSPTEEGAFYEALATLYVIIFLIASLIALFLSRSITRGVEVVSNAMKNNPLTADRKHIAWSSRDEIGVLVNQYNLMIDQLADNAKQLAQAEKESAWKQMAQQVAHEVKNPLTPMRLMTQMHATKAGNLTAEEVHAFADGMLAQIDAMTQVADDFSQLSKGPSKDKSTFIAPIVLEIQAAYPMLKVLIPRSLEGVQSVVNRERLIRVLNNLISNAKEASVLVDKPQFSLMVVHDEHWLTFTIKDNGCGIDPANLEDVFQPRFTTKSRGTGLGLAIVKAILDRFGGTIWVEASSPEGSEFCFTLPVKA